MEKNIYKLNILLAIILTFLIGFIIGGQRVLLKTSNSIKPCNCSKHMHNQCSKSKMMKKLPNKEEIVIKEISPEEANKKIQEIENKMNKMHNEIMQQHRNFFNIR
ncbi:MAG: hypothetical protein OIF36_05005 [Alphaproteobacteria bacterium]|jgi:hypothetical protein|nr:hypothetical protein [Alphaproteobacteria bacterium]MCV6599813.1 hypothetical protein [Alphaproteobacteria bacterium]